MAEQVRVRRNIWSLESEQTWHPITRAFGLAVGEMQSRDASDPTSWQYQAEIHGVADGGQPDQFRGQCQHNSWFFLPWHRLYLHWFEQTVLAAVQAHPDIDDETKAAWALPYWNYGPGGERATLPEAFRQENDPDGNPNPLFDPTRNSFINDGEELDPRAISAADALSETVFSLRRPAGGFGGAPTGFNHFNQDANAFPGMLEQTPHNDVHSEVGGDMGGFDTAGLDPVFWMHHANIDRLWVVWLGQEGRENPDPTGLWGTTSSHFHNPESSGEIGSAADVLDTAAQLGYEYEETDLPDSERRSSARRVPDEPPPDHPAELVGATEDPVELTGGTQRVGLSVGEASGPAARGGGPPKRVYLTVEGIEGERNPGVTYAVYVNLPGDTDEHSEAHYAGNVSFFGIERTGKVDTDPGGHGMARSFDITGLVAELRDAGRWDPNDVSVSFVPLRQGRGASDAQRSAAPPVKIGRVGVYFQ